MKKDYCNIDLSFLEFVYLGLQRLRRGRDITVWDVMNVSQKVLKKLQMYNKNTKRKKVQFKDNKLRIDKQWLDKYT